MRCFIAVNLPAETRQALAAATAPLRAAHLPVRWTVADGLHVTLRFLGEIGDETASGIAASLSGAVASVRRFELGLGGLGAFPDLARPRVVWAGVEPHPALELLANDVARVVLPFGFAPELRPFRPHVTIGRARPGARRSAFAPLEPLASAVGWAAVVPVESVDLMQSTLAPSGATYRVLHRAVLGGD
jgi:2'-5' RNA ligase